MMIKVMSAQDQSKVLMGEPANRLIKMASGGWSGEDFRALVKRAGHLVADAVKDVKFEKGEVPVHSIALGSGEWYGHNRNGDFFSEDACRKHHKTFEKYARAYRDHENKDPSKSYGTVKLALYNEPMHRIELIIGYNGTKEAAERNGGLVADEELNLLNKGSDFDTSMACKVAYDVCSCCGNRARTRADYCKGTHEGGHCKGGGLKNNMGTVLDDGTQVYAENPHPLWFDNSKVWRHADRIAVAGLLKSAASIPILGGAALAESLGVTMPWEVAMAGYETAPYAVRLAVKLASHERALSLVKPRDTLALALAYAPASWTNHGGTMQQAITALAHEKIALPLRGFLELVLNEPERAAINLAPTQARLPGVYTRMLEDGSAEKLAYDNPFAVSPRPAPPRVREWAHKLAADYSLDREHLLRRAMRAGIYRSNPELLALPLVKEAGAAEELARHYAAYKLAFLHSLAGTDPCFELTSTMVVRQNYVQQ
jgi:hypothetical protein